MIEGSGVYSSDNRAARKKDDGMQIETLEHSNLVRWEEKFSLFGAAPNLRRHLAAAWAMWEQADYGLDADIVEATDWGLSFVPPALRDGFSRKCSIVRTGKSYRWPGRPTD